PEGGPQRAQEPDRRRRLRGAAEGAEGGAGPTAEGDEGEVGGAGIRWRGQSSYLAVRPSRRFADPIMMVHATLSRLTVFTLAFLSFACLLGQFYGLWSMQWFGCWVLPPATVLLAVIAYLARRQPAGVRSPFTWIVEGAVGGLVAAVAYDLY